jgi:hypothetical protein
VSRARQFYDLAAGQAQTNEYCGEAALALELAGEFYLDQHNERLARHCLQDAWDLYRQWGAAAKQKELEGRFPEFLPEAAARAGLAAAWKAEVFGETQQLDWQSLMKALRAISGEIVLEKLVQTLMHIILENAGAQLGYLILPRKAEWVLAAGSHLQETYLVPSPSKRRWIKWLCSVCRSSIVILRQAALEIFRAQ